MNRLLLYIFLMLATPAAVGTTMPDDNNMRRTDTSRAIKESLRDEEEVNTKKEAEEKAKKEAKKEAKEKVKKETDTTKVDVLPTVTSNDAYDIARLVEESCRYGVSVLRSRSNKCALIYTIDGGYILPCPTLPEGTRIAYPAKDASWMNFRFTDRSLTPLVAGKIQKITDSEEQPMGFIPFHNTGNLEGYLVWFLKGENQDLTKNTDLQIRAVRKPLLLSEDKNGPFTLSAPSPNALGAIYVVKHIPGAGRVNFYLYGVGVKNKAGSWEMYFPFGN